MLTREKYLYNNRFWFLGSGGLTEAATELAPGQHSFPFSFQLPMNLPSSFEGTKCEVDLHKLNLSV